MPGHNLNHFQRFLKFYLTHRVYITLRKNVFMLFSGSTGGEVWKPLVQRHLPPVTCSSMVVSKVVYWEIQMSHFRHDNVVGFTDICDRLNRSYFSILLGVICIRSNYFGNYYTLSTKRHRRPAIYTNNPFIYITGTVKFQSIFKII